MKRKADVFLEDVLEVFKYTNEEGYKFYATEIENDPANESFLREYKKMVLSSMMRPDVLREEKSKELNFGYFKMLYNGYREFPNRCMTKQSLSLNQEIMGSFQRLVKETEGEIMELLILKTDLKSNFLVLIEKIISNQLLDPVEYDDLKQIASLVCFIINTHVSPFLEKYKNEALFENLVMN